MKKLVKVIGLESESAIFPDSGQTTDSDSDSASLDTSITAKELERMDCVFLRMVLIND